MIWIGLAMTATLLAIILTSPLSFGLTSRAVLYEIEKKEGFCWMAPLPQTLPSPVKYAILFPQRYLIYENGVALEGIFSSQKSIELAGWGRSRIQGGKVYFSTSDQTAPTGRRYEVVTAAFQVPEFWLFVAWGFAIASWVGALRGREFVQSIEEVSEASLYQLGVIAGIGSIASMAVFYSWMADEFFLGLAIPASWAAILALLATARRGIPLGVLYLVSLIPAVATYVYYAVNVASHGSYQVAGFFPMSDAWMHFKQAGQIAQHGATDVAFNGRFLYPAYLSGLLWLSGWNLSIANAVGSGLVMLILGLVCWLWRQRLGLVGTTLLGLLCWLYFREFGSGQVMTEVLGLTCGLLGVICLFLGCEQRRVTLFLLGVFWLSMGSSARPGALFVLPLLGLSGGWLVWGWARENGAPHCWKSLVKPVAVVALAAILVVVPFALNQMMSKVLYDGKIEAFGNFSYSLNGLLTGTNWAKSYEEFNGDVEAIMAENIRLMKTEPWRIAAGIGRAYQYTYKKFFFFRFGPEGRLAEGMKWLCLFGLFAFRFVPALRPHAPWIWAGTLGVILSIPFAPPWDALLRPYAVTVPLQCLIPAAGVTLIFYFFGRIAKFSNREALVFGSLPRHLIIGISLALALLMVLLPVARSFMLQESSNEEKIQMEPVFRTGSFLVVPGSQEESSYRAFQKRLSLHVISRGLEAAAFFTEMPPGLKIGIDWRDLEIVKIKESPSESQPVR